MASWQQIAFGSSVTLAILASRVAPHLLYAGSTWKTIPMLFMLQAIPYLIYSMIIYPVYLSPLNKLPQAPGGSIFMGQFRRIARDPSGEPMKEWMEQVPNDGLINYRTAFNAQRVLLTTPKALAEVLQSKSYDFVKPAQVREGLGRILGVGILLAEGDEHKRQRKNLNPAFAFRHVKDLYPVFWAKSLEMVHAMNAAISSKKSSTSEVEAKGAQPPTVTANGPASPSEKPAAPSTESANNVIEVGEWASRTALDIIGIAGMGRDFNALADPSNELYQTYNHIFKPSRAARLMGIASVFLPPWLLRAIPIKRNDDMASASKTIKAVARDLIQAKRAKLENRAKASPADGGEMEKGADEKDIISVALTSGGFSDEDLVNQLMTFLAAGHETTASSMNWAILQLCRHPDMQSRLRQELADAGISSPFSPNGEKKAVTAADLEKVPYLSAFTSEVLRLNAPVALTLRSARIDTTICDQYIPKGTTVILCPLAVNTSSTLWGDDASEFKPERWLGPGAGPKSNYAFLTFLHGPRSCIGMGFARAEFNVLLAAWVSSFMTELEDPDRVIEVQGGVTSKPKGGLRVKLTPVTE